VAEEARQLVVLGVGNRLRGDDAVGCLICDELGKERNQDRGLPPRHQDTKKASAQSPIVNRQSAIPPDVFVLDCGSAPENYIQPIADRSPERILIIDCCNYGARPGEFRLFSREEVERLSYGLLSTHTLPLTLTIEMLSLETRAAIELLGIQPERIEFGEDLSKPVRRALPAAVEFVRNWAKAAAAAG
jgi:hydrogenase 3 maturation protease